MIQNEDYNNENKPIQNKTFKTLKIAINYFLIYGYFCHCYRKFYVK